MEAIYPISYTLIYQPYHLTLLSTTNRSLTRTAQHTLAMTPSSKDTNTLVGSAAGLQRDKDWSACHQNVRAVLSDISTNEGAHSDDDMTAITNSVNRLRELHAQAYTDVLTGRPRDTSDLSAAFEDLDAKIGSLSSQPTKQSTEDVKSAFGAVDTRYWGMPVHEGRTKGSVAADSMIWPRRAEESKL